MDTKELVAERVKAWEDNKVLLEGNPKGLSAEQQVEFDKRNTRIDEIKRQLDNVARLEADERDLGESRGRKTGAPSSAQPGGGASVRDAGLAFRAWCMGKQASPAMIAAAQRSGVNHMSSYVDMAIRTTWGSDGKEVRTFVPVVTNANGDVDARALEEAETRALSVGTTTAGGNMVPNEMMQRYADIQKWFGRVADLGTLVNTETGATLPWPTIDDTANTGEVKTEGTSANTADPSIGVVNLGAFTLSSKRVPVSWELIQDSFVNINVLLGTLLGRRIARFKNTKFTVGAGTTEPRGLVTGSSVVTAAATTGFTADEVITLIHAVDKAYRSLPDTGFMLHDTILAFIRKMKDGQGRYLWEPSLAAGQPDRLYGYPAEPNNDMDSALTTGKKLVLFGNIPTAFVVRMAGATRFIRDESILVQQHQTYFEAWERGDSNVVDSTAAKVLALA